MLESIQNYDINHLIINKNIMIVKNQLGLIHDFSFCRLIVQEEDSTRQVCSDQFSSFPFNSVGTISSIQNIQNINQDPSMKISTGFLISNNLVLTSSQNFFFYDPNSGKVKDYTPLCFTVLYYDQRAQNKLTPVSVKIKDIKTNPKFVEIFNKIAILKKRLENQKDIDIDLKVTYTKEIMNLELDAIQHDFALLRLQKSIERPQYFKLLPNLRKNTLLTIAAYAGSSNQFVLFTHSNDCSSISNRAIFYDIGPLQSGAPVYISGEQECRQLVGIHRGYLASKNQNCATMITKQIIFILRDWSKDMKASFLAIILISSTIENANNLMEIGNQCKDQGQLSEALNYYNRALNITQKVKGNESVEFAEILSNIGWMHRYIGKYEQSLQCYMKELRIYESIMKYESLQKANAFTNISIGYSRQNKHKQAHEYCQLAVNIYQKIGTQSIQCPYMLHSIGLMYYIQGKLKQAQYFQNRALNIHQKIGKKSIGWANTLYNIGVMYDHQGNFERAIEYYHRSLFIHAKIEKESIQWTHTLQNIASMYYVQGKYEQALEYYDRALIIHQKIGKESIEWAHNLKNIGLGYQSQGIFEQALDYYYSALIIHQKIKKESDKMTNTLNSIGNVYKSQGKYKQALQYYHKLLSLYDKQQGEKSINADSYSNSASTIQQQKPRCSISKDQQIETTFS